MIKKVKTYRMEENFGNYLGNKGTISKICIISIQLMTVTNKKDKQPNLKMGRELLFPDPPISIPLPPPRGT